MHARDRVRVRVQVSRRQAAGPQTTQAGPIGARVKATARLKPVQLYGFGAFGISVTPPLPLG